MTRCHRPGASSRAAQLRRQQDSRASDRRRGRVGSPWDARTIAPRHEAAPKHTSPQRWSRSVAAFAPVNTDPSIACHRGLAQPMGSVCRRDFSGNKPPGRSAGSLVPVVVPRFLQRRHAARSHRAEILRHMRCTIGTAPPSGSCTCWPRGEPHAAGRHALGAPCRGNPHRSDPYEASAGLGAPRQVKRRTAGFSEMAVRG